MNDETTPTSEVREGQRIAKVMARTGLCSRRDAEAWIAAGRVTVNGKVLDSPAYNVSEADDVRVDGRRLAERERTRLFLFHKPRGLVTTARDPEGRPTIFDALPPDLPRVVAVGRLDINTEGLLLLTNDGGLARVLELPATGWLRRYRVRAHGRIDQMKLDSLGGGVTVDGIDYAGIEARLDREQGSNAWITMGLREGKNREIKKVLEHLGLAVNRLIRVSFGPFELGDLAEGEVAEVRTRVLRDQLGAKLAGEAGADFDAPIVERAAAGPDPGKEARDSTAKRKRVAEPTGAARIPPREPERPLARNDSARRGPLPPNRPERRRKHVSALRAEIAAEEAGPRKRIERGATHDRKGRRVTVERLTATGEEARKRAAVVTRRPRNAERPSVVGERPRRPDAAETKRARDGGGRERPGRAKRKHPAGRSELERPDRRESPRKDRRARRSANGGADRLDRREQRRPERAPDRRRPPREADAPGRAADRPKDTRGAGSDAKRPSSGGLRPPPGKGPSRGPGGGSRGRPGKR
jgi:23S rRNA pseudouridine2605 synthase